MLFELGGEHIQVLLAMVVANGAANRFPDMFLRVCCVAG